MRRFSQGEEVLLLLPEKHNKLQLAWKGPFVVVEERGGNNYTIQVKPGRTRVYHANLLRRYIRRRVEANAVIASIVREDESVGQGKEGEIMSPPLKTSETYRDVVMDPLLSPEQQEEVTDLLAGYETILTDRPGLTHLTEFSLDLTDDEPVRSKPYPLPYAKQDVVRAEVKEMLELGVIEPVKSPYASPIVLVQKKDGSMRFCVDYRKLNCVTVFQTETMPDPDAIFTKIAKARHFSKIDLSKGYWQIPVKEEDKAKLAFITRDGIFTWRVMPFGVKNAPSTFTAMMRELLAPLENDPVDNFMDDLLIATETWDEHIRTWRAVLDRLHETGLTARPTKCHVGFQTLDYLGHQLSHGEIAVEQAKVCQLTDAERPRTKRGVRSFLGLAGYYRKFVPKFAQLAAPLTDLTRKGEPNEVRWTDACEHAFVQLKAALTSGAVLKLPELGKEFVLRTDASDVGLGAVILQEHDGVLHPVAYASRKQNSAERKYSVSEKECLAIVFGTQKFQKYLYGREFVLETDHEPLAYLAQAKLASSRLMRWSLILQEYPMRIRYIKGGENSAADYMSRCMND